MDERLTQGKEQLQRQDYTGAIATFSAYLEQDPYCVEAYYQRGVAYYRADQIHAAVSDYGKVLECNPEHAKTYYARALARLSLDNPSGAMADITSAIQWNRENPSAYQFRGRLHRKRGDKTAAIADFKTAARLFAEQKKINRAQDCMVAIQDLQDQPNPRQFTEALAPATEFFRQAHTLIQWGEKSRVLRLLNERLGEYPHEGQSYYCQGLVKLDDGAPEAAIAAFNQSLENGYQNAAVYRNRALAKLQLGDAQGAIADCNQALGIQKDAASFMVRGNAYRAMEHYLGAIEEYAEAIAHEADNGEIYYQRGVTYEAMGETPRAIADFQRAMSLLCDHEKWEAYRQVQSHLERLKTALVDDSHHQPENSTQSQVDQLYKELLTLLGNNQALADGMIRRMRQSYPGMSREWYIESTLSNVKRDMGF